MTKPSKQLRRSRFEHPFKNFYDLARSLEEYPGARGLPSWWREQEEAEHHWDFVPSCDLHECPNHYHFRFDMPGIPKENIKIEVHDNQLSVSGERSFEKREEEGVKTHFVESSYGSFYRSFNLPGDIDAEKVEAAYDQGVLKVKVSKSHTRRSREVSIK